MTALPWPELEALFHEALARPAAERAAWLAVRCAGHAELRSQVEAMLRAHEDAPTAVDTSAAATPALLTPGARIGAYEIATDVSSTCRRRCSSSRRRTR